MTIGLAIVQWQTKELFFFMANEPDHDTDDISKGLRILLVDDDRFLLEFFTRVLTAQGYTTVQAANGAEAETILNTDSNQLSAFNIHLNTFYLY